MISKIFYYYFIILVSIVAISTSNFANNKVANNEQYKRDCSVLNKRATPFFYFKNKDIDSLSLTDTKKVSTTESIIEAVTVSATTIPLLPPPPPPLPSSSSVSSSSSSSSQRPKKKSNKSSNKKVSRIRNINKNSIIKSRTNQEVDLESKRITVFCEKFKTFNHLMTTMNKSVELSLLESWYKNELKASSEYQQNTECHYFCVHLNMVYIPPTTECLTLRYLNMTLNIISELRYDNRSIDLQRLYSTIEILDLRYNRIEKIDYEYFNNFTSMRYLNLNHNKLTRFFNLGLISSLEYVLMSHNPRLLERFNDTDNSVFSVSSFLRSSLRWDNLKFLNLFDSMIDAELNVENEQLPILYRSLDFGRLFTSSQKQAPTIGFSRDFIDTFDYSCDAKFYNQTSNLCLSIILTNPYSHSSEFIDRHYGNITNLESEEYSINVKQLEDVIHGYISDTFINHYIMCDDLYSTFKILDNLHYFENEIFFFLNRPKGDVNIDSGALYLNNCATTNNNFTHFNLNTSSIEELESLPEKIRFSLGNISKNNDKYRKKFSLMVNEFYSSEKTNLTKKAREITRLLIKKSILIDILDLLDDDEFVNVIHINSNSDIDNILIRDAIIKYKLRFTEDSLHAELLKLYNYLLLLDRKLQISTLKNKNHSGVQTNASAKPKGKINISKSNVLKTISIPIMSTTNVNKNSSNYNITQDKIEKILTYEYNNNYDHRYDILIYTMGTPILIVFGIFLISILYYRKTQKSMNNGRVTFRKKDDIYEPRTFTPSTIKFLKDLDKQTARSKTNDSSTKDNAYTPLMSNTNEPVVETVVVKTKADCGTQTTNSIIGNNWNLPFNERGKTFNVSATIENLDSIEMNELRMIENNFTRPTGTLHQRKCSEPIMIPTRHISPPKNFSDDAERLLSNNNDYDVVSLPPTPIYEMPYKKNFQFTSTNNKSTMTSFRTEKLPKIVEVLRKTENSNIPKPPPFESHGFKLSLAVPNNDDNNNNNNSNNNINNNFYENLSKYLVNEKIKL